MQYDIDKCPRMGCENSEIAFRSFVFIQNTSDLNFFILMTEIPPKIVVGKINTIKKI